MFQIYAQTLVNPECLERVEQCGFIIINEVIITLEICLGVTILLSTLITKMNVDNTFDNTAHTNDTYTYTRIAHIPVVHFTDTRCRDYNRFTR